MAKELKFELHAVFDKGGVRQEFHLPLLEVDVTGSRVSRLSQLIGTSEEALDLGEIATGGYAIFVNRSTTAVEIITVTIKTTETSAITLNNGEFACLRLHTSAVPVAVSASGTPLLEIWIVEA